MKLKTFFARSAEALIGIAVLAGAVVFYVNQDAKEIVFSAHMPRFADFNDILELLQEAGDVTIQAKGKVLYVYKK